MNVEQREKRWGELMKLSQSGDHVSYRELLDDLREAYAKYLQRRPHQGIDTEDVIQGALLAVHSARHTYLPSKPFGPWAYTILKYKFNDALRKLYSNQRRNVSLDELQMLESEEQLQQTIIHLHVGERSPAA